MVSYWSGDIPSEILDFVIKTLRNLSKKAKTQTETESVWEEKKMYFENQLIKYSVQSTFAVKGRDLRLPRQVLIDTHALLDKLTTHMDFATLMIKLKLYLLSVEPKNTLKYLESQDKTNYGHITNLECIIGFSRCLRKNSPLHDPPLSYLTDPVKTHEHMCIGHIITGAKQSQEFVQSFHESFNDYFTDFRKVTTEGLDNIDNKTLNWTVSEVSEISFPKRIQPVVSFQNFDNTAYNMSRNDARSHNTGGQRPQSANKAGIMMLIAVTVCAAVAGSIRA